MTNFPTVKRMVELLGITPEQAKRARKVGKADRATLDAMLSTDKDFPKSSAWVAQCYNPPRTSELRMAMLDDVLDTHGVEIIGPSDDFRVEPFASYCNTGDSYACTIVRYRSGTYALTDWASVVEANPQVCQ